MKVVLQLQQLQQLHLDVGFQEAGLLLRLSQLTSLQRLALRYKDAEDAAATACVWKQLRQLQQLQLDVMGEKAHLQAIVPHAAACSALTQLQLSGCVAEEFAEARAGLASRPSITDMHIRLGCSMTPRHMLWLRGFTALTCLSFDEAMGNVVDPALPALAASLKQLRHLDLHACWLQSMEGLAAVGQLTQLTELQLEANPWLPQQGLMQLTGLTRLQRLSLDTRHLQEQDLVRELWAAVEARGSSEVFRNLMDDLGLSP
uniref:Uncharacterized protein n=1 Tax=Tetradesmus obliquus TaxID=3088 RepID=A0A383W7I4_TETOB|eukprot:jgi/Sobl393_1/15804/SZX73607.1